MASQAPIGPELFEFLSELRENNNREWFQANKERYETDVRDPLIAFVADFARPLREISEHFVADPRPVGGSVFRIYRDVRFSKDKTPYKTQAAAHFRHQVGKEVHGPGLLHPHGARRRVRRRRHVASGLGHAGQGCVTRWWRTRIGGGRSYTVRLSRARFKLQGESLKRPPKGYDPDHPLIEDLKRKDFLVSQSFSQGDAYGTRFIDTFADFCRSSSPLMEFLTTAVGLPW